MGVIVPAAVCAAFLMEGYVGALALHGIAVQEAWDEFQDRFPEYSDQTFTSHNNEWDAYRHAYASAKMASFLDAIPGITDEQITYIISAYGDLNEANESDPSALMDYYNNEQGINIGLETDFSDIATAIENALSDGTLVTSTDDPRLNTVSPDTSRSLTDVLTELEDYPTVTMDGSQQPMCTADSPTYYDDIRAEIEETFDFGSPLILDLDGDGVELTSLSTSDIFVDIDNDNFAELTGWVDTDDGILAVDLNEDGVIDGASEFFGNQTGYDNGFLALASYDSNSDGLITAEDGIWTDLVVWVDANSNGYSESTELYTMSDKLITSIDLSYSDINETNAGNQVLQESTFVINGSTNDIEDVYFAYDNAISFYSSSFDLDLRTMFLPGHRGYGDLPELTIAMSLDNDETDTDSLISLVIDLTELSLSQLFTDDSTLMDDIEAIMHRWAGVDGVSATSRGPNIDARHLEFLESYIGQDFKQTGSVGQSDPGLLAALQLEEAFYSAQSNIYARLLAQVEGGSLFEGSLYYDSLTDLLEEVTGLDTDTIDTLETQGMSETNPDIFWQNVVRVIEYTYGVDNLSTSDQDYLDDAIYATDNSLTLDDIVASLAYEAPDGTTYTGTSGNDTLTGGTGNDLLKGLDGDDTLEGGIGDDELRGGNDDDILKGQAGQDYLKGEAGDDKYHWDAGHGEDIIVESGTDTDDRIILGSGFDENDLTFTRINDGLVIDIDNGTQTGKITIENQFNSTAYIELIEFDDTSTYDLDGQSWTTTGTSGDDTIRGVWDGKGGNGDDTIHGGAGNDKLYAYASGETDTLSNTLYGEAGNDELFGGSGADTLEGGAGDDDLHGNAGADILKGGAGNDSMDGGLGDDDFYYISGHDVIDESGGTETLYLDASWDSITPQYLKVDNDMVLWFDEDNTITLNDFFASANDEVETLEWDDTTTEDLTTVSTVTQGDENNNTLNGNNSVTDTIYGYGGDDTINGKSGDDFLYGGEGDDDLTAGYGTDFMDGGAGDDDLQGSTNNDTFYYSGGHDYWDEVNGTDIIQIASGWEFEDLSFIRYETNPNDLWIEIDANNSIELNNQLTSSGKWETLKIDGDSDRDFDSMQFTTMGTTGNDNISGIVYGGSTDDIIYGLDGNDTINPSAGNDTVYGGDGDDTSYGYSGDDILHGEGGDDTLQGGSGNDTFYYTEGLDTVEDLHGGTELLIITGGYTINDMSIADSGTYDAKITINSGTDEITVNQLRGAASKHIETVQFDDGFTATLPGYSTLWFQGTASADTQTGTSSDEVFVGKDGDDDITANGGTDHAHGGDGDDDIDGGAGDDLLYGGEDDDSIIGGTGDDTIVGGTGTDTIDYSADSAAVIVDLSAGTATDGNSDTDTLSSIENVTGSDYADTIDGDDNDNMLSGGAGADTIKGDDGNDTLEGGNGNDTLNGEGGLRDRVTYANDSAAVIVNLATSSATDGNSDTDTLSNIEDVTGSGYNDTIDGDSNDNILDGAAGDDTIDGGTGDDILIGGTGDDDLDGEAGTDTVSYEDDVAAVTVNLGTGSATDGNGDTDTLSNIESAKGSAYNDSLIGSSVQNILYGQAGNDTLSAGADDDILWGGDGNDTLNGGADDDVFWGEDGDDTLNGDSGVDIMHGGNDDDTLSGDAGNDILYGEDGLDTLRGDGGNDTFVFENATAFNNIDVIEDFDVTSEEDVLDIANILYLNDYEDGVDTITDWVEITDSGSDSVVKIDTTGTGTFGAGTQIATLEGITGITDEAQLVTDGNLLVV